MLINANVAQIPIMDRSVHCVVTSPPYWSLRDYSIDGQLGLEQTPDEYVATMVNVFREVRRVMRDDATLWLNMGDSYHSHKRGTYTTQKRWQHGAERDHEDQLYSIEIPVGKSTVLKSLDLCNIPHRLASALQADGWYWRSTIIWHKSNPMPESMNGWRWERCRTKIAEFQAHPTGDMMGVRDCDSFRQHTQAEWQDCPGCEKCETTDGYVLKRGNWRPTTAHEYIFLMAKSNKYFCDAEAVREKYTDPINRWGGDTLEEETEKHSKYLEMQNISPTSALRAGRRMRPNSSGRNMRSVWKLPTRSYSGAHFATFPPALVEPCVKAGAAEKVCAKCGAPWAKVVEKGEYERHESERQTIESGRGDEADRSKHSRPITRHVLDLRPTCECGASFKKATVFDPFVGSGTTIQVARGLGRYGCGTDLSFPYLQLARERLKLRALNEWIEGREGDTDFSGLPMFDI